MRISAIKNLDGHPVKPITTILEHMVTFSVQKISKLGNNLSFLNQTSHASLADREIENRTKFFQALHNNNLEEIGACLEESPDLLNPPQPYKPPIDFAIDSGFDEMAALLYQLGANDNESFRHFYLACQYGLQKTVAHLLTEPLKFNLATRNKRGYTCLHALLLQNEMNTRQEKLSIAKMLLEKEPKLLEIFDKDENTPLHLAAEAGETAFVKLFLLFGADPNKKNIYGDTPLFKALHSPEKINKTLFEELILHPSTFIDEQDRSNQTALEIAVQKRLYKIALLLISRGANIKNLSDPVMLKKLIAQAPKKLLSES